MAFIVQRIEVEGPDIVAIASIGKHYPDRWRAQNDAERLARRHSSFSFDQEQACWVGSNPDGRTYRYVPAMRSLDRGGRLALPTTREKADGRVSAPSMSPWYVA